MGSLITRTIPSPRLLISLIRKMSRIPFLARLPKHPSFEFAFGLEPIVKLTA
jgi:hypothetical protein